MAKSAAKIQSTLNKAQMAMKQEHFGSALLLYRKAHAMDKNNHAILFRLGHVLVTVGYADEAVDVLKQAAKRKANDLNTLVLLSHAQLMQGDIDGMHATLDKALARDPLHEMVIQTKAVGYLDSGMIEEAKEVLDRVADLEDAGELIQMTRARYSKDTKDYDSALKIFGKLAEDTAVSDGTRRNATYELGAVLDKLGEYDRAFTCFERGNAWHGLGRTAHTESLQKTWSPEILAQIPEATISDDRPVIIAGMPRSGTTLMEQVIGAHALGGTVGECPLLLQMRTRSLASNLDQEKIDSYAKEYLELLDRRCGTDIRRVVDKHMGSEKDLGFVSKVLPGLHVIHALRDPRDCCLSAYTQNFGANVLYSRDLKMLGEQYVVHREMMDYWMEHLEIPVYTSVYEEFVSDQKQSTRSLLEFLGIEFDESCLKFYEKKEHVHTVSSMQVRQPIYQTSKQRWKNYEKHIGPLLEGLGPYADGVHATSSR
jgi:tetratricopeptide (TPR) repeat protein